MGSPTKRIVSDKVRKHLRRLLNVRPEDGHWYASAIADRLVLHGLALHPFDLAACDWFVTSYAADFGQYTIEWATRRQLTDEDKGPNDTTWLEEKLSGRTSYLEKRRRSDPEGSRILLETVIGGQPANAKAELILALTTELSPDDIPFLERMASDRATTVRAAATSVLGQIPGTAAYQARYRDVASHIKTTSKNKRGALVLEPPATLIDRRVIRDSLVEVWPLFRGLQLDPLADVLGLKTAEMIARAEEILRGVFFSMATQEKRLDLVQWIALHQEPDAWHLYRQWPLCPKNLDLDSRLSWVEVAFNEAGLDPIYRAGPYNLYRFLRHPLPERKAIVLLDSDVWAKRLQRMDTSSPTTSWSIAGDLMHLAALMPPACRARFRADIAAFSLEHLSKAHNLLDALDAIDESVA